MKLVHRDKISRVFWEPYIITGYRKTNTSVWECVKYAFTLHNDVGNFWTHFLSAIAWMVWLYFLSFRLDLTDPFWYPLLAIWFGSCTYALCSAMAHFLACKSLKIRQLAFMIDYQGISVYTTGGSIAYFFYERMVGFPVFNYKWMFIGAYVLVSFAATAICCLSRFYWEKYRYIARGGSFSVPYFLGVFSYAVRFLNCLFTGEQCIFETIHLHIIAVILSMLMLFFFVSKVPERYYPGSFDFFFHSHQLFHITSIGITSLQLYYLPIDALARKQDLTADPYLLPDLYSTAVPLLVVFSLGFLVVSVLGFLVFTDMLVSNKSVRVNSQQQVKKD